MSVLPLLGPGNAGVGEGGAEVLKRVGAGTASLKSLDKHSGDGPRGLVPQGVRRPYNNGTTISGVGLAGVGCRWGRVLGHPELED